MSDAKRNVVVGASAIIAVLGFAYLLMRFGEIDALQDTYPVVVLANNAAGLREGSSVQVNGVQVGQIESVRLAFDREPGAVEVVAAIERDQRIPTPVEPTVTQSLIGSAAVLDLRVPRTPAPGPVDFLATDGSAVLTMEHRSLREEVAAQLDRRMEPLLESLENFNRLAATYQQVGENVNDLLVVQTEAELAAGEPPNLHTAVARLNARLDDAARAFDLANEWLGDEQLRADVRTAVANATTLIDNASSAVQRYVDLAGRLETDSSHVAEAVVPVMDRLSQTLEGIRRLTAVARTGEGTIAQLLNNPDLYLSLEDAAQRLDVVLREAQLLFQRLQAEGVTVEW